jgi:hypothetical protein
LGHNALEIHRNFWKVNASKVNALKLFPYVHNAPFSPARVFVNAFTVLPTGIAPLGLKVPNSNIWAAGFGFSFWVTWV